MSETARSETVAPPGKGRRLSWVLAGMWMLAAGVMHLFLLRTHLIRERDVYGVTAGVLCVVGLAVYFGDRFLGLKGSTWALLLAITCGLIAAVVIYDIRFLRYIHKTHYELGNFRKTYQTKHAPLYGMGEWPLIPQLIWPILATAAAGLVILLFRGRLMAGRISAWWFVLLQLVLTVSFGLSDGTGWLRPFVERRVPETTTMPTTRAEQTPLREMLHEYVRRMPLQEGRLQHYPPGFNLYRDYLLRWLRIRQWQHHLMMLLVCLTPLPLSAVMRELGLNDAARTLGLFLFSSAIGVLVYARADFSVPAVPLSATCVWLLLRGARSGEWWAGVLLGIVFAAFTLFAFTSLMLAVAMGLMVVMGLSLKTFALRSALRTVLVAGVVSVAIFVALHAWSGFSIYQCLQQGRANEAAKFGSWFDDSRRYSFRSIGHVLAYVVGSGFALSAFALMALPRLRPGQAENRLLGIFAWSLAAAILFAGFSGGFHGETERVWLFFTPLLAVVAGYEWQRRSAREGMGLIVGVILLVLLGNCAQELFYKHQSRNVRMNVQRHRAVQMEEE